jgi:hypothetical protein
MVIDKPKQKRKLETNKRVEIKCLVTAFEIFNKLPLLLAVTC